jgi:glycosyltransferase 2 family protein
LLSRRRETWYFLFVKRSAERLLVLVGIVSSAIFVALAVRRLALADIRDALGRAELWPWLPLAVLTYLTGHLVRGWRCGVLVSREASLTLPAATNVVVLGYAVNNVLPARLGEFARAAMLAQKSGLPYVQSLAVTLLERILDGLVLVLLLVVASFMAASAPWITTTLEAGAIVFGVAALGVLVALLAPSFLVGAAGRVGHLFGARAHDRIVAIFDQVVSGVAYLRDVRSAGRVLALSVLVWCLEAGMFLMLLPAFGIRADPWLAILVMTVTNLGILVPSTPGFVGPFHFFCMRTLVAFGVTEATAFSYAVLAHLSFYVPITLWGVGILFTYGLSLRKLAAEAAAARPLSRPANAFASTPPRARVEARAPSEFSLALLETWLPFDDDHVEGADRTEVLRSCARFVDDELAELPGRLLWMYAAAMYGFRVLTAVVHLRSFCALPLTTRRRWIERWAFGGWALARQLFRGSRATALVAYYEHPIVLARLGIEPRAPQAELEARADNVIALAGRGSRG